MAHGVMTPPEIDPGTHSDNPRGVDSTDGSSRSARPVDFTFKDTTLKEENVFSSMVSSIRDVFFPAKLPPLELESKPIAVVDRMAVKRDPVPAAISTVINGLILLIILFFAAREVIKPAQPKQEMTSIVVPPPPPPPIKLPPAAKQAGGGGGQHSPAPAAKGTPPPPSQVIVPPKAPPTTPPKIAVNNAVDIPPQIKLQSSVPTIGIPNGANVGVGLGTGKGNGLGNGTGDGVGDGSGGGVGGGVHRVGGRVSAPVPIYTVEPEFSEEARKTKTFGNVVVNMIIDESGRVTRVRVISEPGQGLGQKAIEAVKQFRFKPAMENGKPVSVQINYEVNFQIF